MYSMTYDNLSLHILYSVRDNTQFAQSTRTKPSLNLHINTVADQQQVLSLLKLTAQRIKFSLYKPHL